MLRPLRLALLAAILLAALAPAAQADSTVERSFSAKASEKTREYWTPARIRSAQPLDLGQSGAVDAGGLDPTPAAIPRAGGVDLSSTIAPSAPRKTYAGVPKIKPGERPPYSSGEVPLESQTTFPLSTNGLLVGKLPGFGNYSCSATVVSSESDSVLMTAGHCVYDFQVGFAKRVAFAPAYHRGDTPFGVWSASDLIATKQWKRQNYNYDYATVRLRKSRGKAVGAVVGEQGVAFDQPRAQSFQAVGYPFNKGKAEEMWNCVGDFAGVDPRGDRTSGEADNAIGCDMKQGASGGGWFIVDSLGGQYLNSVTSFGYKNFKKVIFGPYLTRKVTQVVRAADR